MYLLGRPREGIAELDHDHIRVTQHFSAVSRASLVPIPLVRYERAGWLQRVERLDTGCHWPDPLALGHVTLPWLALEFTSRGRRHLIRDVGSSDAFHFFKPRVMKFWSSLVVVAGDKMVSSTRAARNHCPAKRTRTERSSAAAALPYYRDGGGSSSPALARTFWTSRCHNAKLWPVNCRSSSSSTERTASHSIFSCRTALLGGEVGEVARPWVYVHAGRARGTTARQRPRCIQRALTYSRNAARAEPVPRGQVPCERSSDERLSSVVMVIDGPPTPSRTELAAAAKASSCRNFLEVTPRETAGPLRLAGVIWPRTYPF